MAGKRLGFESIKSHLGKRLKADEPNAENRGKLYIWMRDVISITQPKVFIAENVKGLTNLGDVKDIIESDFRNAAQGGYLVIPARVLHSANYGVPQSRERVIFFGFKKNALNKKALQELSQSTINPFYDPYPPKTHYRSTSENTANSNLEPQVTVREAFIDLAPNIDQSLAPVVSLDIIGAAIYKDFEQNSNAHFNLFNKYFGDIYLMEQPPEIYLAGRRIVLSTENLIKLFILVAIIIIVPSLIAFGILFNAIKNQTGEKQKLENEISQITKFLKDNEDISSDLFDEGDEIRVGLGHNKNIYSYYTIVGTEIPQKLWLTHMKLSDKVTIEGQADNLESVYSFFRNIKDYNPESDVKLQKLGLAASSASQLPVDNEQAEGEAFDTDSLLTSLNADFYEFRISNEPEVSKEDLDKKKNNAGGVDGNLPELVPIDKN